jgi:hypothetical protein
MALHCPVRGYLGRVSRQPPQQVGGFVLALGKVANGNRLLRRPAQLDAVLLLGCLFAPKRQAVPLGRIRRRQPWHALSAERPAEERVAVGAVLLGTHAFVDQSPCPAGHGLVNPPQSGYRKSYAGIAAGDDRGAAFELATAFVLY